MDAWGGGAAGIDSQREEDEHPECPAGALRFSGIYIRAALQHANGASVYRIQSVEEERGQDQGESGGASGAQQYGAVGRSVRAAESEVERLASVLRTAEPTKAYRAVDEHVYESVRHFLRRRHKVSSHGTRQFPRNGCLENWAWSGCRGRWARVRESTMKPVGKPDAGNPHVRFDERGWETGRRSRQYPRPSSTLPGIPAFSRRRGSTAPAALLLRPQPRPCAGLADAELATVTCREM